MTNGRDADPLARKAIGLVKSLPVHAAWFKNVDTDAALRPECRPMRGLRWLLRAVVALTVLALCVLLWGVHEYQLDLKTAWKRALRPTARFTIDPARLPVARYARVLWLGDVPSPRINEVSGLAVSRRNRDLLWTINDSGDGPDLYAIGEDGALSRLVARAGRDQFRLGRPGGVRARRRRRTC